jgi:transcriptional regulator with XRE-family HTH domain
MTTQTITRFAAWRREAGLSQQQAADLLGVSKSIVADWDAGAVRGRGTPIEPPLAVQIAMGVYRVHGRIPKKYTRDT